MRVLALDLATSLGWACGSTEGTSVSHGIEQLPSTGEDIGKFVAAYRDWLAMAIDEMEPDQLVYEMPILPENTSLMVVRKLNGLCAVTELVVTDLIRQGRSIDTREANLTDIRKHFVGVARAPKGVPAKDRRKWIKARVVAECVKRGFKPKGDDDADAIALLDLWLSQLSKGYSLNATPLFANAGAP